MATWDKIRKYERENPTASDEKYRQSGMRRDLPTSIEDHADLVRPENRKITASDSDNWVGQQ